MSSAQKRPRPASLDRSVTPPNPKRKPRALELDDSYMKLPTLSTARQAFKVVSWNINGAQPFIQKKITFSQDLNPASSFREVLKRHGFPALFCLQEVKIAASDISSQRRLQQAANHKAQPDEPLYDAIFSLPRDKYNALGLGGRGQVHGVATFLRKDLDPIESRRPPWDLEGRILVHSLANGLTVINGYWVNGTSNPYRNSITGEQDGTRHDLKLRYHQHILEEVLALQSEGKSIVLVGDMNVARARIDGHPNLRTSPEQHVRNRQDFNDKFFDGEHGMRGIDIFRHLHGQKRKFTWHSTNVPHGRVCDRVDYVIVSRNLIAQHGAIIDSDICDDASDKLHSDHVPIWLELDLAMLPDQPVDSNHP